MAFVEEDGRAASISAPYALAAAAYALVLPFDFLPSIGGRSVPFPFAMVVICLYLVELGARRGHGALPAGFISLALALLGWATLTGFWSASDSTTVTTVVGLLLHIVLAAALIRPLMTRRRRMLSNYVHGTAIVSLVLLREPVNMDQGGRATIGGVDTNTVALGLAMGFAVAIYLLVFTKGAWRRTFLLAESVGVGAGILYTGSRTGAAAVVLVVVGVAGVALWGAVRAGRLRPVLFSGAVIGTSYYVYSWAVEAGYVPDRVRQFLDGTQTDDSGRSTILEQYLSLFDEWVLIGVGYGADVHFLIARGAGSDNAHSLFWKTWIELGLLGLVLTFAVLAVAVTRGLRSEDWQLVLLMTLAYGVFAYSLGGDRTDHFWWFLVIALSGRLSAPRREPEQVKKISDEGDPTLSVRR